MIALIYLLAIVTANLIITALGPAYSIVTAFVFIGLDLTLRDKLHDVWQGKKLVRKMAILILSGSLISYVLNTASWRIGLASALAFGLAAIVDTFFYDLLKNKKWLIKVNGSNLPSALVDSIVFPTLAFGVFAPVIILGQFAAKVFGGAWWSFVVFLFRPNRKDSVLQRR